MKFYPTRLRFFRETKQMSQKELALLAGVSCQAISQYERGENQPRPRTVYKLAEALRCSVYDISDLKPPPDDPALRDDIAESAVAEGGAGWSGQDGLTDMILDYCVQFDKHERADIIKLLGMWTELTHPQRTHCLHCMEGIVRGSQGSARSA